MFCNGYATLCAAKQWQSSALLSNGKALLRIAWAEYSGYGAGAMRIAARQSWAKAVNRVASQMLCDDELRRGDARRCSERQRLGYVRLRQAPA